MITSAYEFVALRTSENLEEQQKAAYETATEDVWFDVIARFPDMRIWVAHNKTVPLSILHILAKDFDPRVRWAVARKRKLDAATLEQMANDVDDTVRLLVASHKNTPLAVLEQLLDDPWNEVATTAHERLAGNAPK